jgi:hypothetical protein
MIHYGSTALANASANSTVSAFSAPNRRIASALLIAIFQAAGGAST